MMTLFRGLLNWKLPLVGSGTLSQLGLHLEQLSLAFHLLELLESSHAAGKPSDPPDGVLLVDKILDALFETNRVSLDLEKARDAYLIDLLGNTICSDLLDYTMRDSRFAGLKTSFDDRFLRYLVLVSKKSDSSKETEIHVAVQFYTNKMRHDILSEMSNILRVRYLISEAILLHPTKCAAGAMLGAAMYMLGFRDIPDWLKTKGDESFLASIEQIAAGLQQALDAYDFSKQIDPALIEAVVSEIWRQDENMKSVSIECLRNLFDTLRSEQVSLEDDSKECISAARTVLWKLEARRFPKLIFRLRHGAAHSGGADWEKVSEQYKQVGARYTLERKIEAACHLPRGSVFAHCPRSKTTMKLADVLVVGTDLSRVDHLKNICNVNHEPGLGPYQEEVRAISKMYESIWKMHIFLDRRHLHKALEVAKITEELLGFHNDGLLHKDLDEEFQDEDCPYTLMATTEAKRIAPDDRQRVITELDNLVLRNRSGEVNTRQMFETALANVLAAKSSKGSGPMSASKKKRLALGALDIKPKRKRSTKGKPIDSKAAPPNSDDATLFQSPPSE